MKLPEKFLGGRRATAREVIAYIDLVPLKLEHDYWADYADRLTPDERTKLLDDKATFTRPRRSYLPRPALASSGWLQVTHNFHVKLKEQAQAKVFVYEIAEGRDNRSGGTPMRPIAGSPLSAAATIFPVNGHLREAEPAKVPAGVVKNLPKSVDAKANYAELKAEDDERRAKRSLIDELRSSDLTMAELAEIRATIARVRTRRKVAA